MTAASPPVPTEPVHGTPVPAFDTRSTGSTLTAEFFRAIGHQMGPAGEERVTLTPDVLARAVAQLLPVDAAGLSTLVDVLRLPLGASTDAARVAEQLQTTLGEGPCLSAAAARTTCLADPADILSRWPRYSAELIRTTPFRSVASVPLRTLDGEVFAALDLYAKDPHLSQRLDLDDVTDHIGAPLAALLHSCIATIPDIDSTDASSDGYENIPSPRLAVWVAIGMLKGRRPQSTLDALVVLRDYARRQDRSLDDVGDDLLNARLTLDDVIG